MSAIADVATKVLTSGRLAVDAAEGEPQPIAWDRDGVLGAVLFAIGGSAQSAAPYALVSVQHRRTGFDWSSSDEFGFGWPREPVGPAAAADLGGNVVLVGRAASESALAYQVVAGRRAVEVASLALESEGRRRLLHSSKHVDAFVCVWPSNQPARLVVTTKNELDLVDLSS